jgi:flagellar biosynthesis anti-sigma factor FlgM
MKINGHLPLSESQGTSRPEHTRNHGTARRAPVPGAGESSAQDAAIAHLSALTAQLAALPEVRQERVQQLQQALASGQYRIDTHQVARAMLQDWGLEPSGS